MRARESRLVRRRGTSGARLLAAAAIVLSMGLAGAGSASADSLQACVVAARGTCLNVPVNNAHAAMLGSTQVATAVCALVPGSGSPALPALPVALPSLPALPVRLCRARPGPLMAAYDLIGLDSPAAGVGTYTSGGLDCGAAAAGWQVSSTSAGVAVGGARDCAHDGNAAPVLP
jgi:hypothetical protein